MAIYTTTFTADSSVSEISFTSTGPITMDNVSLKEVTHEAVDDNVPVKEFLTGQTDDGREIFFRADTQTIQIQSSPEMYSNPIAVATETERGSMLKIFASLDDKQFYELEGTATKGVSVLKFNAAGGVETTPPITQTVQISYRDSSLQLCRILQLALITIPTPIDYAP